MDRALAPGDPRTPRAAAYAFRRRATVAASRGPAPRAPRRPRAARARHLQRPDLAIGSPRMKWITREHPRVDRVACPWLVEKFVDKNAEFAYVPADSVLRQPR